jgi:hypothetical protein
MVTISARLPPPARAGIVPSERAAQAPAVNTPKNTQERGDFLKMRENVMSAVVLLPQGVRPEKARRGGFSEKPDIPRFRRIGPRGPFMAVDFTTHPGGGGGGPGSP